MVQATVHSEREIARAIRSARRQRGWTQAELAAQANVSTRVVEKLEQGHGRTLNLSTIFALLRALSLDLSLSTRKGSLISFEGLEDLD